MGSFDEFLMAVHFGPYFILSPAHFGIVCLVDHRCSVLFGLLREDYLLL